MLRLDTVMTVLREFFQSRYALIPKDEGDERQSIHPNSAEYKRHTEYLNMVRTESPAFLTANSPSEDTSLETLCDSAFRSRLADAVTGCSFDGCAAGQQRALKLEQVRETASGTLAQARAARRPLKGGQSTGGNDDEEPLLIMLLNFVEDVIAQTVGFDNVGPFLHHCVLSLEDDQINKLLVYQ